MGNADSIPLISQVKSLVQVIAGDGDAALQTVIVTHIQDGAHATRTHTYFFFSI